MSKSSLKQLINDTFKRRVSELRSSWQTNHNLVCEKTTKETAALIRSLNKSMKKHGVAFSTAPYCATRDETKGKWDGKTIRIHGASVTLPKNHPLLAPISSPYRKPCWSNSSLPGYDELESQRHQLEVALALEDLRKGDLSAETRKLLESFIKG